jgi:hypothetical protein
MSLLQLHFCRKSPRNREGVGSIQINGKSLRIPHKRQERRKAEDL